MGRRNRPRMVRTAARPHMGALREFEVAGDPSTVLRTVFGHDSFRGEQEAVIRHVIAGGDAVVLFPTGAGKSLCYQIPALCREGVGIVISPLIALMRDQVEALRQAGVRAAALNSSLPPEEAYRVRRALGEGDLDLLYVTPERLVTEGFLELLSRCRVALFAIDEAHCVSQWGHDFRPEYLQLGVLKEKFPGVPRIALTATANQRTREDLLRRLELRDARLFASSFDRPNIRYAVVEKEAPQKQLREFLRGHAGDSGIVYCLSRAKVDETAAWLNEQGVRARPYHAGLDRAVREANQDAFLKEDGLVLVATIAFGMGVDKPDVRFVAHLDLPSSLEAYYQETGRAGRDGLPSDAWMTYGMADLVQRRRMVDESGAADEVKRVERAQLNALLGYCETTECRRKTLLAHFGEAHAGGCGHCDNCLEPLQSFDGTEAAQKVLSAIYRTGQRFGAGHIVDVLRGNATEKVQRARHDALPTFGVGKDLDARAWQSAIRQLAAMGAVYVDHAAHGGLKLGEGAREILRGERRVTFRQLRPARAKKRSGARPADAAVPTGPEQELFDILRATRLRIATEQNVPPYVVFHDSTLREMARLRPRDKAEMARISGVGQAKLDRYGDTFLAVIARSAVEPAPSEPA